MDTKANFESMGENVVYVKSVAAADLSDEIRDQIGDLETVFAVHDKDGAQLAVVANRKLAVHLAKQSNMRAVALH